MKPPPSKTPPGDRRYGPLGGEGVEWGGKSWAPGPTSWTHISSRPGGTAPLTSHCVLLGKTRGNNEDLACRFVAGIKWDDALSNVEKSVWSLQSLISANNYQYFLDRTFACKSSRILSGNFYYRSPILLVNISSEGPWGDGALGFGQQNMSVRCAQQPGIKHRTCTFRET